MVCQHPENGPILLAAAATLCNLGFVYRHHGANHTKATAFLSDALELQERIFGTLHGSVISTMDNLADSYADGGLGIEAVECYKTMLLRIRAKLSEVGLSKEEAKRKVLLLAEAVVFYKMSRVHRQRNVYGAQIDALKMSLRSARACSTAFESNSENHRFSLKDTNHKNDLAVKFLERRLLFAIRECRERLEVVSARDPTEDVE